MTKPILSDREVADVIANAIFSYMTETADMVDNASNRARFATFVYEYSDMLFDQFSIEAWDILDDCQDAYDFDYVHKCPNCRAEFNDSYPVKVVTTGTFVPDQNGSIDISMISGKHVFKCTRCGGSFDPEHAHLYM